MTTPTSSVVPYLMINNIQQTYYFLCVALAIGLLIGIERGWQERDAKEGERVAGVRTYGLLGLMGGVTALLTEPFGHLLIGLAFVGLSGLLAVVYTVNARRDDSDVGITSLTACLLTFMLGALAATGEIAIAAASAVVTTLLLGYKPLLHSWIHALEGRELRAGLKLLLISVVLLPILPNQGFGPWQTLNPYVLWWMVVVIATISFIGYFAIKIGGTRKGTAFTGLFGGLVSSTALTLNFSRIARLNPAMTPMLATGILLACGTMYPRILLLVTLLNPDLLKPLLLPTITMAIITYLPTVFYWRLHSPTSTSIAPTLKNPLELKTAVSFGLLLALVMLLGKALKYWFGETGLLVLAAASGISDVDAITLSLARMSQGDLTLSVATFGVIIAASVNSIAKSCIATIIGGKGIGLRVGLPLLASAVGGLIAAWFSASQL